MALRSPPTRLMDAESSLFMIRNYGKFYSSTAIERKQITDEIEAALRLFHKDYSAEEIKARFDNLKRSYIKYKQDIDTGKAASIKWTYLEDMDKIMTPSKKTCNGSSKRVRSSSSRTRSTPTSDERYIDVTGDDPEEDFLVRKKFKLQDVREINRAIKLRKSESSMKASSWSQSTTMPNQHAAANAVNGLQPSMSPDSPPVAVPLPSLKSPDSPLVDPTSSPESPEPESKRKPKPQPERQSSPSTPKQQPSPNTPKPSTPKQQQSSSASQLNGGSHHPGTPQGIDALMAEVVNIQKERLAHNNQRQQIDQEMFNWTGRNFHLTSRLLSVVYKTLKIVSEISPSTAPQQVTPWEDFTMGKLITR